MSLNFFKDKTSSRKSAPPPDAVSRVVRWAILLFFAYALFTGAFRTPASHPKPPPASGGVAAQAQQEPEKDCETAKSPFQSFASIASVLIPSAVPVIRIESVKEGEGAGASCGQRATLHYAYALQSGTQLYSNYDSDPIHVMLGDGHLLHGVEMGIMGMKPGGERQIAFPSVLGIDRIRNPAAFPDFEKFTVKPGDLKGAIIIGRASLIDLSPKVPSTAQPLRVIDRKFSGGMRVQCGDTVRVRMGVWKTDGTKIFSTEDDGKPLVFTVGASQVPFGIEQSMFGMGEQGERTAIIPAGYTQPLNKDITWPMQPRLLAHDIVWPDEAVIAEIVLEHVGDDAPSVVTPSPEKADAKKPASSVKPDKDEDDDTDEDEKPKK